MGPTLVLALNKRPLWASNRYLPTVTLCLTVHSRGKYCGVSMGYSGGLLIPRFPTTTRGSGKSVAL
jgi:hypothetical protein